MYRLFSRFQGLRWKLTWPYMLAAPLIMLCFHLLFFLCILLIGGVSMPRLISPWIPAIFLAIIAYDFFSAFFVSVITNGFTTNKLTSRFHSLVQAAKQWSQGDFSIVVQDSSQDEIGQLTRSLNQMAEQLQNLLQTRQRIAVLEERQRLARDLHDSVKQNIFVVSLHIGTLRLRTQAHADTEMTGLLVQTEQTLQNIQQELSTLIRELRPVALERGLSPALHTLVVTFEQQTGIHVDAYIEDVQGLPPLAEEAFLRIAQEALANVVRHSLADTAEFRLQQTEQLVELSVKDNGRGFSRLSEDERGYGLRSMQERMKSIGGSVQIEGELGKGTHIVARIAEASQLSTLTPL